MGRAQYRPVILRRAPVGFITVKGRPLAERFIACTRKLATSDIGRAASRRA